MNKDVSPWRVFWSLAIVGGITTTLAMLFPENNIQLGDLTLRFYRPFFLPPDSNKVAGIEDAADFLSGYDQLLAEDSTAVFQDSAVVKDALLEERRQLLKIQRGASGIQNLDLFFLRAEGAQSKGEHVRVLHYGDSQIEGDRISRDLRDKMQQLWGGSGPGLVTPVEVVPSSAIISEAGSSWKRHTIYGAVDKSIKHQRYGIMGSFADFDTAQSGPHALTFKPSGMSYAKVRRFSKATLYFSTPGKGTTMTVLHNGTEIDKRILPDSSWFKRMSWSLPSETENLELRFEGGEAELYALALDGGPGVQLDNIGMRGGSGTIFKKINGKQFSSQLSDLNPALILLQFGGNTVPYVTDTVAADNYGNWMKAQILYIRKIVPEAAIILIGPSDMAYKEGDSFVTYPYLVPVRDALKRTALETGCGFWDIYEAMGGQNSMSAWVEADPPLAAPDYVHFSPAGAKKVSNLLFKALSDEYEDFKRRKADADADVPLEGEDKKTEKTPEQKL